MKIIFEYEETHYLPIRSISVIGDFNDYDTNKGKMSKSGNKWVLESQVKQGQHFYKFLINECIKLNDPIANLYLPNPRDEELWSILIVNEEGNRLYNNSEYAIHIQNYNITNNIYEKQTDINKKDFNTLLDKKVVTRFEFINVTGLHSVSAVWFNSYGELFDAAESMLFTPEGHGDQPIIIWFSLDIQDNKRIYSDGLWTIRLFIDGSFILEDKFNLGKLGIYPQNSITFSV